VLQRSLYEPILTSKLEPDGAWSLVGRRCFACGATDVGASEWCARCGATGGELFALPTAGVLWSYTIVRHRPPGDCRLPEPFEGLAVGLVELNGVRVLAPLQVPFGELEIGMPLSMEVHPLYEEPDGTAVMSFQFRATPVGAVE